jgi:hypothetical protein
MDETGCAIIYNYDKENELYKKSLIKMIEDSMPEKCDIKDTIIQKIIDCNIDFTNYTTSISAT